MDSNNVSRLTHTHQFLTLKETESTLVIFIMSALEKKTSMI